MFSNFVRIPSITLNFFLKLAGKKGIPIHLLPAGGLHYWGTSFILLEFRERHQFGDSDAFHRECALLLC